MSTCLRPSLAFRRLGVHSPTPIKLLSSSTGVRWTANASTKRRGPDNTWPAFQNQAASVKVVLDKVSLILDGVV